MATLRPWRRGSLSFKLRWDLTTPPCCSSYPESSRILTIMMRIGNRVVGFELLLATKRDQGFLGWLLDNPCIGAVVLQFGF